MNFYNQIAHYYRHIFPLNTLQAEFLFKKHPYFNSSVLDIGCAIGDLSSLLLTKYDQVTGIDLDDKMIELAKQQVLQKQKISFRVMDMLQIAKNFNKESFNLVVCFGNTLVHLETKTAVSQFFQNVKKVLAPNGKFIFQIINYDRIFEQNLTRLSTIDNDVLTFERNYIYLPTDTKIAFETTLTIKSTKEVLKNTIPLLALRKKEVVELLKNSGFKTIHLYGNFKGDELNANSVPLIVEAW